jgi:hypothetical protein
VSQPLARLLQLLRHGLETTAPLWPAIQTGYALVHHAAHLLANHDELDGATLRQAYQDQVLSPWRAHAAPNDPLATAAATFAKVSESYWPNLFHCYDVPALPRTNNDLEQYFGAAVIWSGAPLDARWPRRRWWCVARCGWSPCWPPTTVRSRRTPCAHAM